MLSRRLCTGMRQEKADHFPAGVGSARVGVGAAGAAAGPSMARAVKDPLLKDLPAGVLELDRAGVGHAGWRLAMRHRLGQSRILPCLGDDVVAVARVDGPVGIAMECDGLYRPPFALGRNVPPPPMAAKADGMSRAAPQASPEWTPTAVKMSG